MEKITIDSDIFCNLGVNAGDTLVFDTSLKPREGDLTIFWEKGYNHQVIWYLGRDWLGYPISAISYNSVPKLAPCASNYNMVGRIVEHIKGGVVHE